jgi:hypothetical protein
MDSTMLASLVAGRIAGLGEVVSRFAAIVSPDPVAVSDHADSWEREHEKDLTDPIHVFREFGVVVRDRRDVPDKDRPARGRAVGVRSVESVTGVCWHQTAHFGLSPDHPKLLALPAHAHIGETRSGLVVVTLLHRLTAYVYHGHGWNRSTVGIEVQANAAGIDGDPSTFWRSKQQIAAGLTYADVGHEVSDGVLRACTATMHYYAKLKAARGAALLCLNRTHRQSARKPSDPGSRIARHVAEEARRMGWTADGSQKVLGKGRPQPDEWTGLPNGTRYR